MGLDLGVARFDLALERVVELEVLSEDEEVLWAVVPSERGSDFRLGCVTACIAMRGEVRDRFVRRRCREGSAARGPADVTDDHVQLQVHLHERLLHAVDRGRSALDERLAVTKVTAQGRNLSRGSEATLQ